MPDVRPRVFIEIEYGNAAIEYSRHLKDEDLMEAPAQGTQRQITLASFALLHLHRPDVQGFNELLVQYEDPRPPKWRKKRRLRQVVPDNMLILCEEPLEIERSFNLPLQPCGPFLVLEYVSRSNSRKDFEENMVKYEQELKVPYYLLFYPDIQELTLLRHTGERYNNVLPNEQGRHPIPELEVDVALLDAWVRYWFRGELLPLPEELQQTLNETREELRDSRQKLDESRLRLGEAERAIERERAARLNVEQELELLRAQPNEKRQQGSGDA